MSYDWRERAEEAAEHAREVRQLLDTERAAHEETRRQLEHMTRKHASAVRAVESNGRIAQEQHDARVALEKWRADVTVALGREGGAFYEDVPKHVSEMRRQLERLRGLLKRCDLGMVAVYAEGTASNWSRLKELVAEIRAALEESR